MNKKQALKLLIDVCRKHIANGKLSLSQTNLIFKALDEFNPKARK